MRFERKERRRRAGLQLWDRFLVGGMIIDISEHESPSRPDVCWWARMVINGQITQGFFARTRAELFDGLRYRRAEIAARKFLEIE